MVFSLLLRWFCSCTISLLLTKVFAENSNRASYHYPRTNRPYQPYGEIEELNDYTTFDNKSFYHKIERDGLYLEYQVTLVDGVYSIDSDENIVHVDCNTSISTNGFTVVEVYAVNSEAAFSKLQRASFVVGDHTWGCISGGYNDTRFDAGELMYRKVDKVYLQDSVVYVESRPVAMAYLFESTSVRLNVPPHIVKRANVKTEQGEYNYYPKYTYSANYDSSTGTAIAANIDLFSNNGVTITCEQCYFTCDAGITFELDTSTSSYGFPLVTNLYMDTYGDSKVSAYLRVVGSPLVGKSAYIPITTKMSTAPISFYLGPILFYLYPGVQLFAQTEIVQNTFEDFNMFGGFTASASIRVGMSLDQTSSVNDFDVVTTTSWKFDGTPLSMSNTDDSGVIHPRVYLIPRLTLSPYGLVDFYVDVKPYLGVEIYSAGSSSPSNSGPGTTTAATFNAATVPGKPASPGIASLTAGIIQLSLYPPTQTAYAISQYNVQYQCLNCYNYYFSNALNPSSIGFYSIVGSNCVYPSTSTAPIESKVLSNGGTVGTNITCADLCLSNSDCKTFNWKASTFKCDLYSQTATINTDTWDKTCNVMSRSSMNFAATTTYQIREGDSLGYTAVGDTQSTLSIEIDLGSAWTIYPYAYEVRYQAVSAKGISSWSDYANCQISLRPTVLISNNMILITAQWDTNIRQGEIINVEYYVSGFPYSTAILTTTKSNAGSTDSLTYYIGGIYKNCYNNGYGNSQNLFVKVGYAGQNPWATSSYSVPYNPVSAITYSSTSSSVWFQFTANSAQITKTQIVLTWFLYPYNTFNFSPMSSFCNTNYVCTVSQSGGFDPGSYTATLYAYDAAGNKVTITSFTTASRATMGPSEDEMVTAGNVTSGPPPQQEAEMVALVSRPDLSPDGEVVGADAIGEETGAAIQSLTAMPFTGITTNMATPASTDLAYPSSQSSKASTKRNSSVDRQSPRLALPRLSDEWRGNNINTGNTVQLSDSDGNGNARRLTSCGESGLEYYFYVGVALLAGIEEFAIPKFGLVIFSALQTPVFNLFDPYILPYDFAQGCLVFPPVAPQIIIKSPVTGDNWGLNTAVHTVEWNYWNIDSTAAATISLYLFSSSTPVFSASTTIGSNSYQLSLSDTYFNAGDSYYVRVTCLGVSLSGNSGRFNVVPLSQDLAALNTVSFAEEPYDEIISFSGVGLTSGSFSLAFSSDSQCQSKYSAYPMNVLCTLQVDVSFSGYIIYSFTLNAGTTVADFDAMINIAQTDKLNFAYGLNFPEFVFPAMPTGTSYFFKLLEGRVLTEAVSFPSNVASSASTSAFTSTSKGPTDGFLYAIGGLKGDLCLSTLLNKLSDPSSDTDTAANKVQQMVGMLGLDVCLLINIDTVDTSSSLGGMKFKMSSDVTLFDRMEVNWQQYFDSIDNNVFQTWLMTSGSASEKMAQDVFEYILSGLGLSDKITYQYDIGEMVTQLLTSSTRRRALGEREVGSTSGLEFFSEEDTCTEGFLSGNVFQIGSYAECFVAVPSASPTALPTFPTPSPTALPTAEPTAPKPTVAPSTGAPTGSGFFLPLYSTTDTNNAQQNTVNVDFSVCGGHTATFSLCSGTACSTSVTGDTHLRLFQNDVELAHNDDHCGVCSEINHMFSGGSTDCYTVTLHQGCFSAGLCSGQTGVTIISSPTAMPTAVPTSNPTVSPTADPTARPTAHPVAAPTWTPIELPSADPTENPTRSPTATPTAIPTATPTATPTAHPSANPTANPSVSPSVSPSMSPSMSPTAMPTTAAPSTAPSTLPTPLPGNPTMAPTNAPTPVPTVAPTNIQPVSLGVSQTIDGTSIDDFNSDPWNYTMVFKRSIASCMSNVTVQSITQFDVSAASPAAGVRRGLRALQELQSPYALWSSPGRDRRLAATDSGLLLVYTIQVALPGTTYDTLSKELTAAVQVGTFNTLMHQYAEDTHIPLLISSLSNATSTSVSATNLIAPEPVISLATSGEDSLSEGAIAGIVICALFVMFAGAGAAFYYWYYNNTQSDVDLTSDHSAESSSIIFSVNNPALSEKSLGTGTIRQSGGLEMKPVRGTMASAAIGRESINRREDGSLTFDPASSPPSPRPIIPSTSP